VILSCWQRRLSEMLLGGSIYVRRISGYSRLDSEIAAESHRFMNWYLPLSPDQTSIALHLLTGDPRVRQFRPQQGERSTCISRQGLSFINLVASFLPVWLEVLRNHHSGLNNSGLLGKLGLCKSLYMISIYSCCKNALKLTVASLLSPIFLPTNF